MNRLVVLTLVLAVSLSVPVGTLLAGEPAQTQTQSQTQTQTQAKAGDCVCDGPNCDGDCPQNSYQTQSGNAHQGDLSDGFKYLFQLMLKFFGGGGE